MAAVLLRRLFVKNPDDITQISKEVLDACRAELLAAVVNEGEKVVRKAVCDAVAELARVSIGQL